MKNKEKYDLTTLDFRISSSVSSCGRGIDPKHIQIWANGKKVHDELAYDKPMKAIMRWLENE